MANEVVFVGAGPIGLWTAIQLKLKKPELEVFLKEKHEKYIRTHTLNLEPKSFDGCLKDDKGVIAGIIAQLKKNPHFKTDAFENTLRALALELGIKIDKVEVKDVQRDVVAQHPKVALIIGADGVHSKLRTQIFGEVNVIQEELAFTVQIKYNADGKGLNVKKILEEYPLLKQSNYLSFINTGKEKDGKSPVTIQFMVDKKTYDLVRKKPLNPNPLPHERERATFANPIKLFAADIEEQLPPKLLADIKTQLGFRLSHGEDIIIDDVTLTATALPQQRCLQVTKFDDHRAYGVVGDAALALSYFQGMNRGLQLATQFSKVVVANWNKILLKDKTAFNKYERAYASFSGASFKNGHKTNHKISGLTSVIKTARKVPLQFLYFDNSEINDFHRHFGVLHQISQFYLDAQLSKVAIGTDGKVQGRVASALNIKKWFDEQMSIGLPMLKENLKQEAVNHEHNKTLFNAINNLTTIDESSLDLYNKAYYGLALSQTTTLLRSPTIENCKLYLKFISRIESKKTDFTLLLSSILEIILGVVVIALGLVAAAASSGIAVPALGVGVLLAAQGIYKMPMRKDNLAEIQKSARIILQEKSPDCGDEDIRPQ